MVCRSSSYANNAIASKHQLRVAAHKRNNKKKSEKPVSEVI